MARVNAEGATAAAQYFIELTPYVLGSLDAAEWDAMRMSNCSFCNDVASDVRKYRKTHEHEQGGTLSITSSSAIQPTDTSILVHFDATEAPSRVVDAAGTVVHEYPPPAPLSIDVLMHLRAGAWRVREVTAK